MKLDFAIENLPRGIYTIAKPAGPNALLPGKYLGAYHMYLAKSDGNGDIRIIRSGPIDDGAFNSISNKTRMEAQIDIPHEQSYDSILPHGFFDKAARNFSYSQDRYYKKWNISAQKEDILWEKMKNDAQTIHSAGILYGNTPNGKFQQNSNSFISSIAKRQGLQENDFIIDEIKNNVPGIKTDLFNEPVLWESALKKNPNDPKIMSDETVKVEEKYLENMQKVRQQYGWEYNKSSDNPFNEKSDITQVAKEIWNNYSSFSKTKEDSNPELTRVWDSIMKGGNDEKDDAKKAAAKEEAPEKSYYDRYKELEDPVEDLLYKKPESLTQEEVNQAHKRSFESKDPAERQRYDKIVSEYYRTNYSNRPQQLDETGKGIEPQATRRIPEQGSPLLSSSGRPVDEEIRSTSERLSQIDGNPFHDSGVRGLQRGLNKAGASPQLKEDGELGPKTTSAWKRAATENPAKLNQALGTGSMENLITKNRGTTFSPQDLDNSARSAWGDEGGRTLQRGLNQAGSAKEDYEPLKEDNDVGKKTTSAFNRLKEEDEDGLLSSLNKMIV